MSKRKFPLEQCALVVNHLMMISHFRVKSCNLFWNSGCNFRSSWSQQQSKTFNKQM